MHLCCLLKKIPSLVLWDEKKQNSVNILWISHLKFYFLHFHNIEKGRGHVTMGSIKFPSKNLTHHLWFKQCSQKWAQIVLYLHCSNCWVVTTCFAVCRGRDPMLNSKIQLHQLLMVHRSRGSLLFNFGILIMWFK